MKKAVMNDNYFIYENSFEENILDYLNTFLMRIENWEWRRRYGADNGNANE